MPLLSASSACDILRAARRLLQLAPNCFASSDAASSSLKYRAIWLFRPSFREASASLKTGIYTSLGNERDLIRLTTFHRHSFDIVLMSTYSIFYEAPQCSQPSPDHPCGMYDA